MRFGTESSIALVALLLLALLHMRREHLRSRKGHQEIAEADHIGGRAPNCQHPQIDAQKCIGCGACVAACPEDGVLALVHGCVQIVHGSRCIGHGKCAEVCPVQAITIGLGDLVQRGDFPTLSDARESSVAGLFIAGELGGLSLIKNAIKQGMAVVDAVVTSLSTSPPKSSVDYPLVIVGAGPAGLSASLRARECGLTFLTIDQDSIGGTINKYPRHKLTMTEPTTLPLGERLTQSEYLKEELIEIWQRLSREHQLPIATGVGLVSCQRREDHFALETTEGTIRCHRVILAIGRRGTPRKLGVAGEEQAKVLYQLEDAATHQNQQLLVVGGGDSAIEAALDLSEQPGNTVTLSYRRGALSRVKRKNQLRFDAALKKGQLKALFESHVVAIGEDHVQLTLADGITQALPNDFVYVCAGGLPPFPLLERAGVEFGGANATHRRVRI